MRRTKLADRILPTYTKGEEIFNMISHIVGGALGIVVTTLCVIFAAIHNNVYGVVSGAIYGATVIILYTISSIYHGLSPKKATSKKVFQVLDHCSIFLLIAGTYTPVALCNIRSINPFYGWLIFGVIWGAAVLGIVLNAIDLKSTKVFSMICYLLMGWCIIFRFDLFLASTHINGVILMAAGGVAYTIGAILYGIGKKKKYFHSIFHIFIVIASVLQFLSVLLYSM